MQKLLLYSTLSLILFFSSCAPTRKPIDVGTIPAAKPVGQADEEYGHTVLQKLSETYELDYNDSRLNKIQDIVEKLATSAGAKNEPWHVFLFKAPKVKNAAATRGNHVFVWSGLLDSTQKDGELSFVLAHEMAHLLAGHTDPDPNEQLKRILIQVGAAAAGVAVSVAMNNTTGVDTAANLTMNVTQGIGNEALINPYSRDKELEADHIGLMLMAASGYNPVDAISFWERAQNDPDFQNDSSYFSDHPSNADRLARLKQSLPLAIEYYTGKRKPGTYSLPSARQPNQDAPVSQNLSAPEHQAPIARPNSSTRVVAHDGVKLYRAPTTSSPALGEFSQGAKVQVGDTIGSWVEITQPDVGYIRGDQLKPQ